MKLSRRKVLGIAGAGAATAIAGCGRIASGIRQFSEVQHTPLQKTDEPFVATLNRFAYGPSIDDVEDVRVKGQDAWFESQLLPGPDEPLPLQMMVSRLDTEHFSPWELRDLPAAAMIGQLQQKAVLMAVYSPWQLRERIVEFWTDHFSIYAQKGLASYRKPLDEKKVIRANALGSFPQMLKDSAHSTAMLVYLDQQNSTAAHPNENYARELLELHTLGVDGGYTQADVMEVARCLTGWSEERGFLKPKGKFSFEADLHDTGRKHVLGDLIPSGGQQQDGDLVLDIVAHHSSTARHISRKLCRYFLGASAPVAEARVMQAYVESKGDIKTMLRALYASAKGAKLEPQVRRPFDYVVATLRATGADTDGGRALLDHLTKMGHARFQWPMPDGYPVKDDAWTGSMVGRWRFVSELLGKRIEGTYCDLNRLSKLRQTSDMVDLVAFAPPGTDTHTVLRGLAVGLVPMEQAALSLCSPEAQWK